MRPPYRCCPEGVGAISALSATLDMGTLRRPFAPFLVTLSILFVTCFPYSSLRCLHAGPERAVKGVIINKLADVDFWPVTVEAS